MSGVFEQRLMTALSIAEADQGPTAYGKADRETGVDQERETYSQLAKSFNFSDPEEGKTMNDLALTRFPAGVPEDLTPGIISKFGLQGEVEPDDLFCLRVAPEDINKTLSQLKNVTVEPAWETQEVLNALWKIIAGRTKRWSAGGWNRTSGAYDREARGDLIQNAALAVIRAIKSQRDRGDHYLKWIAVEIEHMVSGGMTSEGETAAAAGFYERLAKASKPEQVDKLIEGIPERDRQTDKPSSTRDGNRFGEHAPELYQMGMRMRDVLVRYQSKDKDEKEQATEEKEDMVKEIEDARSELRSHGRLLAPLTGLYDTVSTPKSDSSGSRFLTRLLNVKNADELQQVGKPPDKRSIELHDKLTKAIQSGDNDTIDMARAEIKKAIDEVGGRDSFRRLHKQSGLEIKSAKTGNEIENPRLPPAKDTGPKSDQHKAVVNQLLRAGLKGVQVGLDKQNRPHVLKLMPRDFRVIIRMFGIKDYPYKGTGKDPEFNEEEFNRLSDALVAVVNDENAEPVTIEPISAAEKRWLVDLTAKATAMGFDDYEVDYDEYEANVKSLQAMHSKFGKIVVVPPDEDTAIEIARLASSSSWVRRGCPQLTTREIGNDLWDSSVHHSTPGKTMKDVVGSPSVGGAARSPKYNSPYFLQRGEANPESKLYKIAQALRNSGELDLDTSGREWGPLSDETGPAAESIKRAHIALAVGALWRLNQIAERAHRRAAITEALDRVDMSLLSETHHLIGRRLVKLLLPKVDF